MSAAVFGSALVVLLAASARSARRSGSWLAAARRLRSAVRGRDGRDGRHGRGRWRASIGAPAVVAARVSAAAPGVHADALWTGWLACGAVAALGGARLGGLAVAVLGLLAVAVVPIACEPAGRRRAVQQAAADVPIALEVMARSVRSGAGLQEALEDAVASASVGPVVGAVFAGAAATAARGQPLVDALEARRADDGGVPGLRMAMTALAMAAETGGPHAAALDGVATTLRQRLAVQAEAAALGAQARTSALVIALAPVAFLLVAFAADGGNAQFLLRTPLGLAMLVVGLVLDGVGAMWMSRLTRLGLP